MDSTEFVTVASQAGVPHPPGTPLYVILASLASLLPIGAAAFRVHLLDAVLGAAAAAMVYELVLALAGAEGERVRVRVVAAAIALATALSPAIWFQSVRAEVYSLNAVICLGLVLLALSWARRPEGRRWPLLMALLAGLGGANHHFLTLLVVIACLVWLVALPGMWRRIVSWTLPLGLLFVLGGLLAYLYLPVRAADGWRMWGDPATLSGFWSMISASAFHISVTEMPHAPVPVALLEIFGKWIDLLGAPLFVLGWLGLAALLLSRRREGWLLLLVILAGGLSKAIMYLDVENPDDHGYFLVGLHALAAAGAGIVVSAVRGRGAGVATNGSVGGEAPSSAAGTARWANAAAGCVVVCAACSGWLVYDANSKWCDLSLFQGPDEVNRHFHEEVPPDALFMPSYYATFFNHLYFRQVEKRRPDVLMVHQSLYSRFEGGKAYAGDLVKHAPEVKPLFDSFFATGAFPLHVLEGLAESRPVVLENDTLALVDPPPELARFSLGDGGLSIPARRLEFLGPGLRLLPEEAGAVSPTQQVQFWTSVYQDLPQRDMLHPELVKLLVWYHYRNALFFLNADEREAATREVDLARKLKPDEPRLTDLAVTLAGSP